MANAGASIEAVLTLNATGFTKGIETSLSAIQKFQNTLSGFGTKSQAISEGIDALHTHLQQLSNVSKENLNTFSRLSTAINKMANGIKILQSDSVSVVEAVNTMNSIFKAFQGTLNGTTVQIQGVANAERQVATATRTSMEAQMRAVATLNANRNSTMQLITGKNQLTNSERQESTATNQASSAHQRNSNSMSQASARTNQLTSATSRLSKAMSSLKMMGSLVGSMLAYNFAHKLLVATGETIHAKSEMEGYFKMLNFGQRDIDSFNQALDRTVGQFQRVNKYSLGETISSIGVEFNLTTKEMEKAMNVTSMITSEYLRAGRNANEASLAVKDVLQGQFQRLSRETGVKGEQLKEAGWSGDTKDVLGLMEALEKVAHDRNWDVFAEKANSLNDILTIIQNRFGEWSADVVYAVQPAIVGAFNMILGSAQKLAGVLEGVWKWLSSDPIGQVVGWSLLATNIMSVVTAFIHLRTGASLLQIAQMGLKDSIIATVLGLEAETVATYGSRNAIVSRITGLEAEKVATMGVKDALLTKILGLKSETVATMGLKGALTEEVIARRIQEATMKGASAQQQMMIYQEYEQQIAKRNTLATIYAKITGLNMETFATHGLVTAMIQAKTGMKASEIASMGLSSKIGVLVKSIGLATPIVLAFVAGIAMLGMQMKASAEEMGRFNDILQNGESTVKENRDLVQQYTSRQESLKQKLSETKQGTIEYYETQKQLGEVNQALITSNANLENSYKALQVANSAQKHYEEKLTDMSIDHQHKLAEAYMDAGYSMREAYEMANDSLIDAEKGAEQLRQTLQKLAVLNYHGEQTVNDLLGYFKETGVDKEEAKQYLTEAERLNAQARKGLEKAMTDDSFMGRMDGWFSYYEAQVENWINNIKAKVAGGDWGAIFNDVWKGIAHGFADLPIIKDFWKWVYEQIGVNKYKGTGWDGLQNLFDEWARGLKDGLINSIKNMFTPNLDAESFGWDPVKDFYKGMVDFITNPLDDLSSLGFSFMDGFGKILFGDGYNSEEMVAKITEYLSSVDILGTINTAFSNLFNNSEEGDSSGIGGLLQRLFNFEGIDLSFIETSASTLISMFGQSLYNSILNIPIVGDILALFGLVNGDNSGASQKGTDIGNAFKNKVEEIIRNIPILGDVLQMLGVIPQANGDAHSKGHGVGENIKQGEQQGHTGTAQNVGAEMSDVITAITNAIGGAFSAAQQVGNAIWDGINSILQRASPGFIHDQILAEFGTDIPNAITSSGDVAYTVAQGYGQSVVDGISSVNFNSFGALATDYESDAQTMISTTQLLGLDTTTAFNDMALAVNTTTNTMGTNVIGTYNSMSTQQSSMLQNMKQQNMTAYNDMYQKSNQSLIQMRDSTSNLTAQMTNAWRHMKDQIVATANQLKSESTSHFNQLSNTIGEFYRKIQNPANWGAGSPDLKEGTRRPMVGRRIGKAIHHGAGGGNPISPRGGSTMTMAQLKKTICPNGDCGSLFDGYSLTDKIDVETFLKSIIGEHGFGWGDWSGTHYNYIKTKSDEWEMKSPVIQLMGGINTNSKFKVGDFENGTPKISFDEFEAMARAIFSPSMGGLPYRFYYDSSWKGSWLGAIQAGACNCWDGANALVAFANTCGFSGGIAHGSWNGIPHVWAVIEGRKMDTTGMQNRGTWTPSASAGSPMVRRPIHDGNMNQDTTPVHVEVNINGNVYGVDDLDSHISESIDKGLEKHFNKAYTIGV